MQSAISGHWSQSIGADLSGQQAISADISTAIGAALVVFLAALAGAENGASTSPAIKKIASRRPRWIEMFTMLISHDPAGMETSVGSLIRQNGGKAPGIINQSVVARSHSVQPDGQMLTH